MQTGVLPATPQTKHSKFCCCADEAEALQND